MQINYANKQATHVRPGGAHTRGRCTLLAATAWFYHAVVAVGGNTFLPFSGKTKVNNKISTHQANGNNGSDSAVR